MKNNNIEPAKSQVMMVKLPALGRRNKRKMQESGDAESIKQDKKSKPSENKPPKQPDMPTRITRSSSQKSKSSNTIPVLASQDNRKRKTARRSLFQEPSSKSLRHKHPSSALVIGALFPEKRVKSSSTSNQTASSKATGSIIQKKKADPTFGYQKTSFKGVGTVLQSKKATLPVSTLHTSQEHHLKQLSVNTTVPVINQTVVAKEKPLPRPKVLFPSDNSQPGDGASKMELELKDLERINKRQQLAIDSLKATIEIQQFHLKLLGAPQIAGPAVPVAANSTFTALAKAASCITAPTIAAPDLPAPAFAASTPRAPTIAGLADATTITASTVVVSDLQTSTVAAPTDAALIVPAPTDTAHTTVAPAIADPTLSVPTNAAPPEEEGWNNLIPAPQFHKELEIGYVVIGELVDEIDMTHIMRKDDFINCFYDAIDYPSHRLLLRLMDKVYKEKELVGKRFYTYNNPLCWKEGHSLLSFNDRRFCALLCQVDKQYPGFIKLSQKSHRGSQIRQAVNKKCYRIERKLKLAK